MQEVKVLLFSIRKSRMKAGWSQEDCFAVSLKSNRMEKSKKSPASRDLRTITSRKLSKNAGHSTSRGDLCPSRYLLMSFLWVWIPRSRCWKAQGTCERTGQNLCKQLGWPLGWKGSVRFTSTQQLNLYIPLPRTVFSWWVVLICKKLCRNTVHYDTLCTRIIGSQWSHIRISGIKHLHPWRLPNHFTKLGTSRAVPGRAARSAFCQAPRVDASVAKAKTHRSAWQAIQVPWLARLELIWNCFGTHEDGWNQFRSI